MGGEAPVVGAHPLSLEYGQERREARIMLGTTVCAGPPDR